MKTQTSKMIISLIVCIMISMFFVGCSKNTTGIDNNNSAGLLIDNFENSNIYLLEGTEDLSNDKYYGDNHRAMSEHTIEYVINNWMKEPYKSFVKTYTGYKGVPVINTMIARARTYSTRPDGSGIYANGGDFRVTILGSNTRPGHVYPADGEAFDGFWSWLGVIPDFESAGGNYADENLGYYYSKMLYYLDKAKDYYDSSSNYNAAVSFVNAAIYFGYTSHYIADVAVPYHTSYGVWKQFSLSWSGYENEHFAYEGEVENMNEPSQWTSAYWYGSSYTSESYAEALVRWEAADSFNAGNANNWRASQFSDSEIYARIKHGAKSVNGIFLMALTNKGLSVY